MQYILAESSTWGETITLAITVIGSVGGGVVALWTKFSKQDDKCATRSEQLWDAVNHIRSTRLPDVEKLIALDSQRSNSELQHLREAIDSLRAVMSKMADQLTQIVSNMNRGD